MTHLLTLTQDEEDRLRRAAQERGTDTEALLREAVLQMLTAAEDAPAADDIPAPGESLADALQGYIGVVDSKGRYNFSEDTGKHFADGLLEKQRQGRL